MKKLELAGQRFGKLIAICDNGTSRLRKREWKCRCDCGTELLVCAGALSSGNTVSCGCRRSETLSRIKRKRPYESAFNRIGKQSKHKVTLSYEEFLEFTKITNCHYCGFEVKWSEFNKEFGAGHNLDRKDSSLGYTKENCLVCCAVCNRMKLAQGYEEFLTHVARIMKHIGGA